MNENEIKSYGGFTIGPIYDVLSHSRKTRELWFGSYFFSWFMEELIKKLASDDKIEFIVPYVKPSFKENKLKAGKYHDRFVVESSSYTKEKLFDSIRAASDGTLDLFVDIIDRLINKHNGGYYLSNPPRSINDVKTVLRGYIQRDFVAFEPQLIPSDKNPVSEIYQYLDAMEEQRLFDLGNMEPTCFKCKTLPAVTEASTFDTENTEKTHRKRVLCPLCFIKYFCLTSDDIIQKLDSSPEDTRYPPILDFAAADLMGDIKSYKDKENFPEKIKNHYVRVFYEKDDDYDFEDIKAVLDEINQENETKGLPRIEIKPFHRYFAILQADGDNLGKLAGAEKLSKMLFDFADEAYKIIRKFRGEPIFIGGDDILAFLPVAFKENGRIKTVFDCAIELSQAYRGSVALRTPNCKPATLSVGINIAYYKFPLSKALENVRHQLFGIAKEDLGKNALAVVLTKHSGYQNSFKFSFGAGNPDDEISKYSLFLKDVLTDSIKLPHGVHHNLSRFRKVLACIPDQVRLNAFFSNNFNEPLHSTDYCSGITRLKELFLYTIDFAKSQEERLRDIDDVLAKLRFIKFLRGDK